jgi:hypothetical protein
MPLRLPWATLYRMKTIGVRDLRQRASEGRRAVLVTRGRLKPADGDLLDVGPPLPAARNVLPASALVMRARNDQR